MCIRVKRGNIYAVAHNGLIQLFICQKLQDFSSPISWVRFIHLGLEQQRAQEEHTKTCSLPIVKTKGFPSQK